MRNGKVLDGKVHLSSYIILLLILLLAAANDVVVSAVD